MGHSNTPAPAFDWQRIIAGPRGRELCLQLAFSAEQASGDAHPLAEADFCLNVGEPNTSYVRLGEPAEPLTRTTDREFLDALASVPVRAPEPDELPDMLQQVVLSAAYWQPPRRRDVLLSYPEALGLLRPWAEMLAGLEHTHWWAEPMVTDDQWHVIWPSWADEPDDQPHSLAEWAADERAREAETAALRLPAPRANCSGRWWSITGDVPATTRRWPDGRIMLDEPEVDNPCEPPALETWPRHRVHDPLGFTLLEDSSHDPSEASWERIVVPATARVREVEGPEAWAELCRRHPLEVSATRRDDWFNTTGRDGAWVIPDWSGVAGDYDAVHLGIAAWLEMAGRPITVDAERASLVAGWSPDETRWLTGLPLRPAR